MRRHELIEHLRRRGEDDEESRIAALQMAAPPRRLADVPDQVDAHERNRRMDEENER